MCGRFVLTANPEIVQQAFNLTTSPAQMQPRYNIAPTQPVMVITNENSTEVTYHKWGLIPSWAKDMSMASKMINARSAKRCRETGFPGCISPPSLPNPDRWLLRVARTRQRKNAHVRSSSQSRIVWHGWLVGNLA